MDQALDKVIQKQPKQTCCYTQVRLVFKTSPIVPKTTRLKPPFCACRENNIFYEWMDIHYLVPNPWLKAQGKKWSFKHFLLSNPSKTTLENAGLSHWVAQTLFRGSPCPHSGPKRKKNWKKKESTFANQQELPAKWEWDGPQIKNLLDFVLHPKSSISKERFMLLQNRVGFRSRKGKNAFYLPEWQSSSGTRKRDHVYHCNVQFIAKVKTEHFTEMHLLHRLGLVPAQIPFLKGS